MKTATATAGWQAGEPAAARVILASASEDFEQRLHDACGQYLNGSFHRWDVGAMPDGPARVVHELGRLAPDVVVLGPDLAVDASLHLTRAIEEERPEIAVVLAAESSPELFERALRAGARGVLAPHASAHELRVAFEPVVTSAVRRRSKLAEIAETSESSRHVVAVLSPKGGAGKTTVATNLAVGLAQQAPGEVAILDLDLQFGDVASALCLTPDHSVADVARMSRDLDPTSLKVFLTAHPSDLFALCAPGMPAEADTVSSEHVRRVAELLAAEFRFVVIDTGAGIDEATLAVLDVATDLVVVSSTDVPTVRNTCKEIEALDLVGATTQRRHLVVNRSNARVGLDLADIAENIGLPIAVAVPSSRDVPVSLNHGSPLLESEPRSPVGRSLAGLVGLFVAVPARSKSSNGRRGRRRF